MTIKPHILILVMLVFSGCAASKQIPREIEPWMVERVYGRPATEDNSK